MRNMRKSSSPKKRLVFLAMFVSALLLPFFLPCSDTYPNSFFAAAAAPPAAKGDASPAMVADPGTLTMWSEYFGEDVEDTTHAGRIWADKSVLAHDLTLPTTNVTVARSSPDHFLTGLSAISSYKNIIGQSTIPVDVVLVLDVSGSMGDETTISNMVQATNASLRELLALNIHNRVGLVLYSGNPQAGNSAVSTATLLLKLDRYTAQAEKFITYTKTQAGATAAFHIGVADRLQTQSGENVPANSVRVQGGTYIQNGVQLALQQFMQVEQISVEGTKRIPIMVLMSDGAPTAGTLQYTDVGTSGMGNGTATSAGVAFVTQLTASHARARMEERYERAPLLYTLGLGFDNLQESDKYIALSVLDPSFSTQTLDNYWETFQELNTGEGMTIQYYNNPAQSQTAQLVRLAGDKIKSIRYADEYFAASNADDLLEAFDKIVEEIVIQSRYYPTQTHGENVDLSGYLVFMDIVGDHMRVKNFNGLVYGRNLNNGSSFSKIMQDAYDPATQTLDLENSYAFEFVKSLEERLNLSEAQAIALITNSLVHSQIMYRSEEDYSNYLLWYGDAKSNYIRPASPGEDPPKNAVTINRTFAYFGVSDISVSGSDLMYIGVRLQTNLATGNQAVRMSIPASLVPMTEYNVLINNDDLEKADTAVVNKTSVYPIRLFYEVGLRDDLDETTARDLVAGDYPYQQADGTYRFYSNAWSKDAAKTTVDYTPSLENEFYYFPRNTAIYEKNSQGGYEKLSTKPRGGSAYYYKNQIFNTRFFNQESEVQQVFTEIAPEALPFAQQGDNGIYYIPKGISKMEIPNYALEKSDNRTESYPYAMQPQLKIENGKITGARMVLGNNGRLQRKALGTGGFAVTKTVTGSGGAAERSFSFTASLSDSGINGQYGDLLFEKGIAHFQLKHGQSATATGLPGGTQYRVTEADYTAEGYVTVPKEATGTIAPDATELLEFVNSSSGGPVSPPEPGRPAGSERPASPDQSVEKQPELTTILPEKTPQTGRNAPFGEGASPTVWAVLALLLVATAICCVRFLEKAPDRGGKGKQ